MRDLERVIIIGAGQAGAQAAISLRDMGYDGELLLIGEEPYLPYQRPPLSKAYLLGQMEVERLFLKPETFYKERRIDIRLNMRVESIVRERKCIHLEGGEVLNYDKLIIATGSRPRRLRCEGAQLSNILELRGIEDIERLRPLMQAGRRIGIIGAGYIGLEAAASAQKLGLQAVVLEAEPRVLSRVTSPAMSEFFENLHRSHGVELYTNARLEAFEGDNQLETLRLNDGGSIPCDIALVGIGAIANQELAEQAGLDCENGIIVDHDGLSSDRDIYAIGDCAYRPMVHYNYSTRLESVHNAIEQGKIAAAAICGKGRPSEDVPWFWSDQYNIKLQIAGLSTGYDQTALRGDMAQDKFALFYLKAGKLIGVDAVNAAPEFLVAKRLIPIGAIIPVEDLVNTQISMKEIAAQF